ncbi:type 2 isopentenyl-diphosphate Delta-isomerase [Lacticaseibacillus jixiensis]|uniref:type 2 isopentenyl-diphosphate Delta-isomerase n=1 Tax=Lacticaseibacillus jixiensis TaxID=3231926 RepID=UPI0036F38569
MSESIQSHRKDEHVFLAEKYFQPHAQAGFEQVRFIHNPLPETTVAEVNVAPGVFDWRWPIYINAMTGGSKQTGQYNQALGRIAAACGVAIASGSQSVALREPELAATFTGLRDNDPSGFIFANLGANATLTQAQTAIKMLDANALELHLNAVQETVMPEGDRAFIWLDQIQQLAAHLSVPVVVKEVGNGFTKSAIAALVKRGVGYIDIGGHGGTSFGQIENARTTDPSVFADLADFGQTTVESLLEASGAQATIFATGGIRTPLDVLKALRLGATAVGISGLVLHWLIQDGEAQAIARLQAWQAALPRLLAMLGAKDLTALRDVPVIYSAELINYAKQRGLTMP